MDLAKLYDYVVHEQPPPQLPWTAALPLALTSPLGSSEPSASSTSSSNASGAVGSRRSRGQHCATAQRRLRRAIERHPSFDETFAELLPDSYERLLIDIARGNQTLFMRSDEVLAAWDYIDPVIEKVRKKSPEIYSADSMGPEDKILIKEGRYWFDPILEQKE